MKRKNIAPALILSLAAAALAGCIQGGGGSTSLSEATLPSPEASLPSAGTSLSRTETSLLPPGEAEDSPGVTITGEPLSPEQLVDFELDYEWTKGYVDKWYVGDFLDGLDDPAFKDLYCRALALARLISTDNIKVSSAVDLSNPVYLEAFDENIQSINRYMESGYTYESFYAAFCSVFTQETADIIFSRYPFFCSYNGEMWLIGTSAGGNVGEVFQEYELVNQTDTELEFKRISYSVPIGEPITDYDPAKKDEYEKTEVEFRFVKTADGWRAEKFLNATDYDRSMLIG